MRPSTSPGRIEKETSLSAATVPYRLVRPATRTALSDDDRKGENATAVADCRHCGGCRRDRARRDGVPHARVAGRSYIVTLGAGPNTSSIVSTLTAPRFSARIAGSIVFRSPTTTTTNRLG